MMPSIRFAWIPEIIFMAENHNRNQEQHQTGDAHQNHQGSDKAAQTQSASDQKQQDQNPQAGNQWSNYRTREMSNENEGSSGSSGGASDE